MIKWNKNRKDLNIKDIIKVIYMLVGNIGKIGNFLYILL